MPEDPLAHPADDALDARLRAAFDPPTEPRLSDMARRAAVAARPPLWPWLVTAAAVALTIGMLVWSRHPRGPEGHDGATLGAVWVAAFEDASARGFGGTCCDCGFDLAEHCRTVQVPALELRSAESSVSGCYRGVSTGGCACLIAKQGDRPVCVYLVPAARDPGVRLPAGCRLHLARRNVGSLVLYALGEQPAEALLQQFALAQQ
ncbi:MAG: hypothetical protein KDC87_01135 [Planctomycetes bacterium]|nr:hypothetical protein [Planctomycetota bacterium]MCB9869306.1 hypothetical protein [Planctomycetota bacterium]